MSSKLCDFIFIKFIEKMYHISKKKYPHIHSLNLGSVTTSTQQMSTFLYILNAFSHLTRLQRCNFIFIEKHRHSRFKSGILDHLPPASPNHAKTSFVAVRLEPPDVKILRIFFMRQHLLHPWPKFR